MASPQNWILDTRRLRAVLLLSTALAAPLARAPETRAQATPATPTPVAGAPTFDIDGDGFDDLPAAVTGTPANLGVRLNAASTIINWNSFNIAAASNVDFSTALAAASVLNRVTGATASTLNGSLTATPNINVWLINPNGMLFGANAAINTGGFVGSTLDITDADFTNGGGFNLTAPAGSTTAITGGGAGFSIRTNNGLLLLVAPRIDVTSGTGPALGLNAGTGEAAFVTASDASFSDPASPLSITINRGTAVPGTAQHVAGAVSGRNVYFALASRDAITDSLLSVDAAVTATSAAVTDRGIVLVAGRPTSAAAGINVAAGAAQTAGAADIAYAGTLAAAGTGGNLVLRASDAITGTATAGSAAGFTNIEGASVSAATLNAATALDVTSLAGPLAFTGGSVTNGTANVNAFGSATLGSLSGSANLFVNATGQISATGLLSSSLGGTFLDSSTAGIDVTDFIAGNVDLSAAGQVAVTGNVTARGNYIINAASVRLGDDPGSETQTAAGRVEITASAGALFGGANLTLVADGNGIGNEDMILDATGGAINFDATSSQRTGGTGDIALRIGTLGQAIALGGVDAGDIVTINAAHTVKSSDLVADGNVTLRGNATLDRTLDVSLAVGSFASQDVTVTGAGQGIAINAPVPGSSISTGDLIAPGDVTLISRSLSLGDVTTSEAGAAVSLTASNGALSAGAITTDGLIDLDAVAGGIAVGDLRSISGGITADSASGLLSTGIARADGNIAFTTNIGGIRAPSITSDSGSVTLSGPGAGSALQADLVRAATTIDIAMRDGVLGLSSAAGPDVLASGNVTINTGPGGITLGTVAGTDITVIGRSIAQTGTITGTGTVELVSNSFALSTGAVSGDAGVTALAAFGNLSMAAANSAFGTVDIRANAGSASVGDGSAAGLFLVRAGTQAAITGNVTAGAVTVAGASVALGDDPGADLIQAAGAIDVTSTSGAITGGAGLTLRSNSDGAGGEIVALDANTGITFDAGSLIQGGPARQSAVGFRSVTNAAVTLGRVQALDLVTIDGLHVPVGTSVSQAGNLTLAGNSTFTNLLDVTLSAGNFSAQDLTVTGPAPGIALFTPAGSITTGAISSATTFMSGLSINTGNINSPTGVTLLTSVAAATDIATGDILTNGFLFVQANGSASGGALTSTGSSAIVTAGTSATFGTVSGFTSATIDVSGAGDVRVDSVTSQTGNVRVGSFSGNLFVDSLDADTSAFAYAGGDVRGRTGARATITAGTQDATVGANGAVLLADASGNSVSLTGGSIDQAGTITATGAGVDLLASTGGITAGSISAQTGITASALTNGAVDIASVGSLTGGADLSSVGGSVTLGSATVAGQLRLAAGTLAAITGDASADTIVIGGASVALGDDPDAELIQAAGAIDVTASAGGITGGAGLTLRANSDGTGDELLALDATGGAIAFAPTSLIEGGPARQSDIGIRLGGPGSVTLGGIAARDLVSIDAGHVPLGTGLTLAGGLTLAAPATFTNTLDVTLTSGNLAAQGLTVTGLGQGIDLRTPAGTLSVGTLSAPGAITLQGLGITSADVTSSSAGTVLLQTAGAGGDITTGTIQAVGNIAINAGGTVNAGALTSTAGSVAAVAAGDITTGAVDAAGIASVSSSGGDVRVPTVTSSSGIAVVDAIAGSAFVDTVTGGTSAGIRGRDGIQGLTGARSTIVAGSNVGDLAIALSDQTAVLADVSGFDVTINGGAIDHAGIIAAQGGSATLTAATGDITANLVAGAAGVTATATLGNVAITTATSSGGGVDLRSDAGSVTLGAGGAAGQLALRAATLASLPGNASAGSILIRGGSVALGDDADADAISASGGIEITATAGAIRGGAGLTLTSDSDGTGGDALILDATGGDVDFDASSVLRGGAARTATIGIRVSPGRNVTLGTVDAAALLGVDAAHAAFGPLLTSGDITVTGPLTVHDAIDLETTGGAISLTTAEATAPTGTIRLVTSGGGTTIDATSLTAPGGITVSANAVVDLPTVTGGNVSISGTSTTVGTATVTGNLTLASTSGALQLGSGSAGGTATLTAAAAVPASATLAITGTLTSAGTATTSSGGATTIAAIESTAGAVSVTGASVAVTDATSFAGATLRSTAGLLDVTTVDSGGNLLLDANGGDLLLGTGTAGGSAQLDSDGTIGLTSLIAAGDTSSISAGSSSIGVLRSTGGSLGVTGSSVTATTLGAGTALSATASAGDLAVTTATSGGTSMFSAPAGSVTIGTAQAGGTMTIGSSGALTATTLTTSAGDIIGQSGSADIAAATSAGTLDLATTAGLLKLDSGTAGGALKLASAGGGIRLGTGGAGGAATLTSGDTLAIDTGLVAGGSVTMTAPGIATIAGVTSNGGAVALTAGSATVTAAQAATSLDLVATAGDLALTDGTSGGAMRLESTAGGIAIGQATAGTGADVKSALGTSIAAGPGLAAGGDVALDVKGALTGGAIASSGGSVATAGTQDPTSITLTSVGAGGAVTLKASGAVDIGSASAGSTLGIESTGSTLRLGSGTATGAATLTSAGDLTTTTGLTSGGAATVTTGGVASLGTTRSTGAGVTIAAASATTGAIQSAGATSVTTSTGNATIASATAGGPLTIDAAGTATLGAVSAGGAEAISIKAADVALNGAVSGDTVRLTNRTPGSIETRLGDAATPAGGFSLDAAELGRIGAPRLIVDSGSGTVRIGALAFAAGTGSTRVDVLTTGTIRIDGVVSGSGAARTFRFGGTESGTGDMASLIRIEASPTAGGRLLFSNAALDLRGNRIAMGLPELLAATGFDGTGTGQATAQIAANFVGNANSQLYDALLGGTTGYSDRATISAGRMTVTYGDYAFFQNSGLPGLSEGATVGGALGSPVDAALTLNAVGGGSPKAFALFGAINGFTQSAAALLGPTVIVTNGIDVVNSRINGCLIGSGAGCLSSIVIRPTEQIFDSSQVSVLRTSDDLAVPFDPVVGSNNEALFSSGYSVSDLGAQPAECDPRTSSCPAQEGEAK